MKVKISDVALVGFVGAALAISILAYLKSRQPITQMAMKHRLQVTAVVRESDCVECIRKVVCYWKNLAADFNAQQIETPIRFWQENESFQPEELGFLCEIPQDLQVHDFQKIKGISSLPMATPSIIVTDGQKILYLEPISMQSQMEQVHSRVATAIGLHLPHASE